MRSLGREGYSLKSACNSLQSSKAAKGFMDPVAATVPGLADPFDGWTGGGLGGKLNAGGMRGWVALWVLLQLTEQLWVGFG